MILTAHYLSLIVNQERDILKIRLFCFLSAIFIVAGLLLPVNVYAVDTPTVDTTVSVPVSTDADTTTSAPCETNTESASAEPVAVDEDVTSADSDTTGTTDQCQDDEGTYSRVSWNS